MSLPPPPVPQPSPTSRLQAAVVRRAETDYVFDFWTALGWTVLTCGVYGFYVFYRLMWRSVEHNRRRFDVLDSARLLAWERASVLGRGEELTPQFQTLGLHLQELERLSREFRDPVIWTIIAVVSSSIGQIVGYVFIDLDLCRHDRAEQAAEQELAAIYGALGAPVALPASTGTKPQHNYVGRVLALVATCGLYVLWWTYDLMMEGNEHQRRNWASDDAFWTASAALAQA